MAAVTGVAAFTAWLGASIVVLSDGRRGLALGLAFIAAAFTALAAANGQWPAAAALFVGGAVAAIQRLRSGTDDWRLMPPGSTSKLLLAIAIGVVALWIAVSVSSGAGAPLRFAAVTVLGLMGARMLTARDPAAVITAAAGMALAIATASGLAPTTPAPAPYIVAALIAAGVSVLRVADENVA